MAKTYECSVCKKPITNGGMKCPTTKEKFHNECLAEHVKNCDSPHMRLRSWKNKK